MTDQFFPCPFCGGEMFINSEFRFPRYSLLRRLWARITKEPDILAYFGQCRCCAATGPWYKSRTAAIMACNRRVK